MPELRVDLDAIGRNTEVVASLLRVHSLDLVGVTKGCLGEPGVAAAMLAGGAVALADTRDQNLRRLRSAFPTAELHRIHLPSLSEPFDPGDMAYVTSLEGAAAVAALGTTAAPRRVMIQGRPGMTGGRPRNRFSSLPALWRPNPSAEGCPRTMPASSARPSVLRHRLKPCLRRPGRSVPPGSRSAGCPEATPACSGFSTEGRRYRAR
jgi:hypothetical protein